ncbi:hypothetical protein [Methylobacterium sp. GC_Met_2]|uniref:hypothetical protein n=1 Tax=Methylobacterium sp. GC_Met_2 TaxID=2937376 RepID=UPI00226B99CE|nr:hypothetical protein [Methylobacterium sp. GC_Met_2]
MDVVLRPVAEAQSEWELRDRLGRDLGKVIQSADPEAYKIVAKLGCSLDGVPTSHATLDGVMSAIAARMGGACSLDSQEWD